MLSTPRHPRPRSDSGRTDVTGPFPGEELDPPTEVFVLSIDTMVPSVMKEAGHVGPTAVQGFRTPNCSASLH